MYSFVAGIFRSMLYVGYSSKLLNIAAVHPFYYCTVYHMGFPCGLAGKESACNAGHLGLIPGLGRSPGEGKATHSSILAWRIPWTEEPASYNPLSRKESDTTYQLNNNNFYLSQQMATQCYFIPWMTPQSPRNKISS